MTIKRALTKANKALAKVGIGPVEATIKSLNKGYAAVDKLIDQADAAGSALTDVESALAAAGEDN